MKKTIAIIIPTHNRYDLLNNLLKCIDDQLENNNINFKVYIINDNSEKESQKKIKLEGKKFNYEIINGNGNWFWTKSINEGIKKAESDNCNFILLLNDDLVLEKNYVNELSNLINKNNLFIYGSIVYDIENKNEINYIGTKWNWNEFTSKKNSESLLNSDSDLIESDSLIGRGMLFPANLMRKLSYFDEKTFPQYVADEDFSINAKKNGYHLYVSKKLIIYSYTKETGYSFKNSKSILTYYKGLFSIKSSYNIIYSNKFLLRHTKKNKIINVLKNSIYKIIFPFLKSNKLYNII